MAFQFVTKQSIDPIICDTSNDEAAPGDQLRLTLDAEVVAGLPLFIYGVVQTPVKRERMFDSLTGCTVTGYEYSIGYESDDLLGVLDELTPDIIIEMGCVTCCQVLDERISALAARFKTGTFANAGGDTLVTVPEGCDNYTVYGTFTGAAGTRNIALDLTNVASGCRVTIVAELPATAAIVINTRNATVGGTLLDTLTTDTSGDNATLEFGFTTVWNKIQSLYPN